MSGISIRKYPWMMFFPADHRADPALRVCTLAARGLWIEMVCLMHEADPYGHLVSKGRPITMEQLASLSGTSKVQVKKLVAELCESGVLSQTNEGTIFSRRMVRDFIKRQRNVENGAKGGNPNLIRRVKPRLMPQTPESKFQKSDTRTDVELLGSPAKSPVALVALQQNKVHVKIDTPQWKAWSKYFGKTPMQDRQFGWHFPTEWPPGHTPEGDLERSSKKYGSP